MCIHLLGDLVVGSLMSCSDLEEHIQLCRMTEESTVSAESCEDNEAQFVHRSHATGVVKEGGGPLVTSARFHEAWLVTACGHGRSINKSKEKTAMTLSVSSVLRVIERNASTSIKVERIVCKLYFLDADHVYRTWNRLGQRAVNALDTRTVIENATTQAAH
ncbi:uncharacterized protein M421DRAFT_320201 [Didymella exigua CBS 183.55]|uniref:Uncharacterized protein n=1 Tax=Didymella exigua CBS 183.55 TaxID=1150837 RepID=A0A6A5RV69_9PLEO|nr:uncharacterized protein M421DRAFT_320201 [Didymella exigua CBS 183.55]KAF1931762.1 hypothetical protein M421DRAFT_320201 [Didymella exigua CBS 183.55]